VEFLLFGVFLSFCLSGIFGFGFLAIFVFILVLVCIGGFGISLLVRVSRFYGRDFWLFNYVF